MTSPTFTSLLRSTAVGVAAIMWSAAVSAATTAQTARPLQEYSETCGASCVETKTVSVGGIPYAYRSLGKPSGTPLVMINRFRGTMDEWDPAFLDHVAAGRYVIIFDNAGVARSGGEAPARMADWAANAAKLIETLGYRQVDVLGFFLRWSSGAGIDAPATGARSQADHRRQRGRLCRGCQSAS
jgi:hypothetical protein